MDHSADLLTVFSGEIEYRAGSPVIQIPDREVELGDLAVGNSYRIAILESANTDIGRNQQSRPTESGKPPVEEGDIREVEIEDVGEQGDGLARVDRGYIVFVPDTELGDRVTVEITETRENVAFAEVIEEEPVKN